MRITKVFLAILVLSLVAQTSEASARRRAIGGGEQTCASGYTMMTGLIRDNDGDKYAVGGIVSVCVEPTQLIGPKPHRYFRGADGVQYLDAASGFYYTEGDCDDSGTPTGMNAWRMVKGAEDADMNGIPDGPIGTACVGVQSWISERWYYYRYTREAKSTWLGAESIDPKYLGNTYADAAANCDPKNPRYHTVMTGLKVDYDHDGKVDTDPFSQADFPRCVGDPMIGPDNRRYYDDSLGFGNTFELLDLQGAEVEWDDNDGDANTFLKFMGGTDADLDGIATGFGPAKVFGGDTKKINGRTYHRASDGSFSILAEADIVGYGDAADDDSSRR